MDALTFYREKYTKTPHNFTDWMEFAEAYAQARLQGHETFFRTVASLTVNHDVVGEDIASVSPKALGEALEKVDPNWYNQT